MTNENLVICKNINLSINQHSILENINFSIGKGQVITIIGPNGAGKTSLLKIILGNLKQTSGSVEKSKNLKIGYMPQKLNINKNLPISVLGFLKLNCSNKNKIIDALKLTDADNLIHKSLHDLSGGEMQKVLLSFSLIKSPNLLILDEPAQGVDIKGQQIFYNLLNKITKQINSSVLMISHDLNLVMKNTDFVICLNKSICCIGEPTIIHNNDTFKKFFEDSFAFYTHNHSNNNK